MLKKSVLLIVFIASLLATYSDDKKVSGFLDFNYYYDTRDFNTLTINSLMNLPNGFQYFGFVNYFNGIDTEENFDLTSYYTEQNLRYTPPWNIPLSLSVQFNFISGSANDTMRLGLKYNVSKDPYLKRFFEKIHFDYNLYAHIAQIELESAPGSGFQIEHVYFWKILPNLLNNRIYLSGFADHNIRVSRPNGGDKHIWVTEHQLGVNIYSYFYAVAEFRYNESLSDKTGLGLGLQVKIIF